MATWWLFYARNVVILKENTVGIWQNQKLKLLTVKVFCFKQSRPVLLETLPSWEINQNWMPVEKSAPAWIESGPPEQ